MHNTQCVIRRLLNACAIIGRRRTRQQEIDSITVLLIGKRMSWASILWMDSNLNLLFWGEGDKMDHIKINLLINCSDSDED